MAGDHAVGGYPPPQGNPYSIYPPQIPARRWTAWLVPLFLVANIVIFGAVMYINDCPTHPSRFLGKCVGQHALGRFSFQPLRENPLYGPSSRTLRKLGALEWERVVHRHQGWRLITCIWLHAGLVHLFVNMLSLMLIGMPLEREFGFVRIGFIYLLSGFGGSVLSSLFIRFSVSVGASGALFGLLGATLSELITNWSLYSSKASTLLSLMIIILVNLGIGLLPHVDNFAHIGGFLTGFLLGFILLLRPQFTLPNPHNLPAGSRLQSKYRIYQLVLSGIAVIVLVVGLVVMLVMLFRGENGNNHCRWCHYLNCVSSSRWQCTD